MCTNTNCGLPLIAYLYVKGEPRHHYYGFVPNTSSVRYETKIRVHLIS